MDGRLNLDTSGYQRTLAEISRKLNTQELDSMKFWCRSQGVAGRAVLEEVDEPGKLWDLLEKRGKLSQRDTSFLMQLLRGSVRREDLINIVEVYGNSNNVGAAHNAGVDTSITSPGVDSPTSILAQTMGQRAARDTGDGYAEELRAEFELISEQYGSGWRIFARKLELTEAEIDRIAAKYPTDLIEQIQQAMKVWCSKKQGKATRAGLAAALRQCQRNKLASKVEKL